MEPTKRGKHTFNISFIWFCHDILCSIEAINFFLKSFLESLTLHCLITSELAMVNSEITCTEIRNTLKYKKKKKGLKINSAQ